MKNRRHSAGSIKNILPLATLNDETWNPLAVIVRLADPGTGTKTTTKIIGQANLIKNIVSRIDHGWSESEKVRRFLMTDCGDRAQ